MLASATSVIRATSTGCCFRRISVAFATLAQALRSIFARRRYASPCSKTVPRHALSYACCQRSDEPAPSHHPRSCRSSVRSPSDCSILRSEGRSHDQTQKECSAFELNLTSNNLANMARFRGQQVSCESVANKKRVLQVECKLPLRLRKGFEPVASTINADSLFQRPHHQVSHESVEPSIALNTSGVQDLYPALGLQCFLQNSHVTKTRKTHRRTTTVPSHPDDAMMFIAPTSLPIPLLL